MAFGANCARADGFQLLGIGRAACTTIITRGVTVFQVVLPDLGSGSARQGPAMDMSSKTHLYNDKRRM
eukprot:5338198-Pleurochrysis_carterae.AAC.1